MPNGTLCTPQPNYVIIEQIHLKTGLPSVGNTIGPALYQVFRRVLQVCDVQDIFFDGNRLSGMPTTWQYLQHYLLPGTQITTRPTGQKQFFVAYAGFKNLLTPLPRIGGLLPESWTREYDLGTPPSPFVYGSDPIPRVQLYGNPNAQFVMFGGRQPPVAVGVYKQTSNRLELPPPHERDRIIRRLIQPRPSRP